MRSALVPLAAIVCLSSPATAQLRIEGNTLEVSTARVRIIFTGPDVTRIDNLLSGETHARAVDGGDIARWIRASGTAVALDGSEWRLGENGGVPVATFARQNAPAPFRLDVWIDPAAEQPVVRLSAPGANGVRGVRWGLRGLDITSSRLILPVAGGVAFDSRQPPPRGFAASSESRWEAPFLLLQSANGGLAVFNAGHQAPFRKLEVAASGAGAFSLAIETTARGPWSTGSPDPVEWRIDCYQGPWTTGANLYKQAAAADWATPELPAEASWVRDIRTVIIFSGGLLDLARLAAVTDPRQTLLYLPNWRAAGYDRNYPDYTPAPELPAFLDRARRLGFRTMLHVNPYGVSSYHPEYARMRRYQIRDAGSLEPQGWRWERAASDRERFAFISPASSEWRALFLRNVRPMIAQLKPDALHLDQTGVILNDGNGPIESMSAVDGMLRLHREIAAEFPAVLLGGEGVFDQLAPLVWFAQRWSAAEQGVPGAAHPLMSYLLGARFKLYGYIGMPGPESPDYAGYFRQYERQAVIQTVTLSSQDEVDSPGLGIARAFRIARAMQQHRLDPSWDAESDGTRIAYSGAAPGVFTASALGSRFDVAGQAVYERVIGAASAKSSLRIPNWPAFDDAGVFGLDPAREYWLDPPAPVSGPRFSWLPDGVSLTNETILAPGAFLLALRPARAGFFDAVEAYGQARTGVSARVDGPLTGDAGVSLETIRSGGVARHAILVHPPGGAASTFAEFAVAVPATGSSTLSFHAGISDEAQRDLPVTFEVRADGELLWTADVSRGAWRYGEADLTRFAGRTVALRLSTRAADAGYAWAAFGTPVAARWTDPGAIHAQLTAPDATGVSAPAPVRVTGANGVFDLSNLPANGVTPVFLQPLPRFSAGQSLLETPPANYQVVGAAMPVPGPVFGSGTVGAAVSGGVTRLRAISAHPPEQGSTRLLWCGELPDAPLALEASAGLQDGNRSGGVLFTVSINGRTVWEYKPSARGWASARIDLSSYRGSPVVIQLITDSLGSNSFDWAYWADLTLAPR